MHWIAPAEKDTVNGTLEKRLWDTADQFRANSGLKAQEYSGSILGVIFLRFAEVGFAAKRAELESPSPLRGERAEVTGENYSGDPAKELSIYGVEKTDETGRPCCLNHAVHGLHPALRIDYVPASGKNHV